MGLGVKYRIKKNRLKRPKTTEVGKLSNGRLWVSCHWASR